MELQHHLRPDDPTLIDDLHRLAGYLKLPTVATNNVHYARREGQRLQDTLHAIRCQGRGSAANSLVAYLLGIGPIDPLCHQLVFERFLKQTLEASLLTGSAL